MEHKFILEAMTIILNKKATLMLFLFVGLITLINLKLADIWSNKICNEGSNVDESADRNLPLIFIGGYPRSGTTLMRAMLDAHSDIRCGPETRLLARLIPFILNRFGKYKEEVRLRAAGVTRQVLQSAFVKFVLEIISRDDYQAPRLCSKEPLLLQYAGYMIDTFPNAKFLFMIRDGRAVAHSLIGHNTSVDFVNWGDYIAMLQEWNEQVEIMDNECYAIGENHCMRVYYEQLVLQPKQWMEKILKFLNLPWNEAVIHHEQYINKTDGVYVPASEYAAKQVVQPIYLDSLTAWTKYFPENVTEILDKIAPMLDLFGYDTISKSPNYRKMKIKIQL